MATDNGKKPRYHQLNAPWKKGQSGNPAGRPRGARSIFSETFYRDILDQWKIGGVAAIEAVRKNDPATFLRVAASILPKEIKVDSGRDETFDRIIGDMNDSELNKLIAGLCTIGSDTQGEEGATEETSSDEPDSVH